MFAAVADDAPPVPTGFEAQQRVDAIEVEGRGIASQISQLQARLVDLAAETETLSGCLSDISTKDYLAWTWGLDPKEAGRLCWLSRRLPRLPKLADAFADGRLSEGVITSMVSVATPELQDQLLACSEVATGAQLRTLVRDFKRVHPNKEKVRPEYHATRVDDDGMIIGNYRLSIGNGATHLAALRAARELETKDGSCPYEDDVDPDDIVRAKEVDAFMRLSETFLGGTLTKAGLLPDRFTTVIVIEDGDELLTDTGHETDRHHHDNINDHVNHTHDQPTNTDEPANDEPANTADPNGTTDAAESTGPTDTDQAPPDTDEAASTNASADEPTGADDAAVDTDRTTEPDGTTADASEDTTGSSGTVADTAADMTAASDAGEPASQTGPSESSTATADDETGVEDQSTELETGQCDDGITGPNPAGGPMADPPHHAGDTTGAGDGEPEPPRAAKRPVVGIDGEQRRLPTEPATGGCCGDDTNGDGTDGIVGVARRVIRPNWARLADAYHDEEPDGPLWDHWRDQRSQTARAHAYLRGIGSVPLPTVTPFLCESTISVIIKRRGVAVTVTSPTRLATKEQLRVLWERDRCCQYPGCGREHGLIAHHVWFYDLGGPTHIFNMLLLCKKCHRRIHQPGWRIELTDHGRTKRFYRPDGQQVHATNPRPTRGDPDQPDLPEPGERHWGTNEPLTYYARDVYIADWLNHTPDTTEPDADEAVDETDSHDAAETEPGQRDDQYRPNGERPDEEAA